MKFRHFLTFSTFVTLFGCPLARILAADASPTPAPASAAKPQPSVDPAKVEWNTARKKALDDPSVKAAMNNARAAQIDANKKMLEKIREIDPALAPAVDKEEERLKPRATMTPKPKPSPKPKKPAPSPANTPNGDQKPQPSPTPQ